MHRETMIDTLVAGGPWDVLVIGGGATGLGSAIDAASRGLRVALVERGDFAQATSSRSTKLIHGGVRYLAQGDIALVRESLRERGLLLRNAPHLVRSQAFLVPAFERWSKVYYRAGLKFYDVLAGKLNLAPSRPLGRQEALDHLPGLRGEGLRGGILYHDGQFDDARLAIALARTLADLGGVPANYVEVSGLIKEGGRLAGVQARDRETGREFELLAKAVINATGVFADSVRRMDDCRAEPSILPSQGAHIVLDESFLTGGGPAEACALMVPRTDDGRVLFAIPWQGRALVGTTETLVGAIDPEPRPLRQEIEFLLDHAARYLSRPPAESDVLSAFAGLRPLVRPRRGGADTSAVSRDHSVTVSPSGLVTVIGGKWTTYRRMGRDAVDAALGVAGLEAGPSRTEELHVHGWVEGPAPLEGPAPSGPPHYSAYGADAPALAALARDNPPLAEALHPKLPYVAAEVVWAARHEMARTVEDVLSRRTRALILDARASLEAAPRVARLLAEELGRDSQWEEQQVSAYRALAEGYLPG